MHPLPTLPYSLAQLGVRSSLNWESDWATPKQERPPVLVIFAMKGRYEDVGVANTSAV